MPEPTTMDDLLNEFEFEVPGVPETPANGITIEMGTEAEVEAARVAAEATAAAIGLAGNRAG